MLTSFKRKYLITHLAGLYSYFVVIYSVQIYNKSILTCGTVITGNGDIFMVSAVVRAPTSMTTVANLCLVPGAVHVVQPDASTARSVPVTAQRTSVASTARIQRCKFPRNHGAKILRCFRYT